ncbi:MAG: MgtE intracellular region [Synergistaceae bacterium]|nr:MgtE intracellular region [Synergistaceae bacterium]
MAEERRLGRQEEQSLEPALSVAPLVVKQKKKLGKVGLFFILLLLSFGVGSGLHFSGLWDARPLIWEAVPQIPYVGKSIAGFFDIPEQYTLTVNERRTYELNERQKRLDERERDLIAREAAVDAALADITARSQILADLEMLAEGDGARRAEEAASVTERELIAQRVRDFNTMSSRNSAQIVEEMRDELAVKILQGLTSDARASILGKMDARKAARLVELLSTQ